MLDLLTAGSLNNAPPVLENHNLTRTLVGWTTPLQEPLLDMSSYEIVQQRQVVVVAACAAVLANLSILEVMPLQMFPVQLDKLKLMPTTQRHSQLNSSIEGL